MKLYELAEQFKQLQEMLEDENADIELIQNTLEGVECEFNEKAENIAKLIKTLDYEVEILKSEKERIENKIKSKAAKKDWLKEYLQKQMEIAKKEKIKTPLFNISIQNNPPSVDIIDMETFKLAGAKYLIPQEPKIDKRALIEDLKAGIEVPGAILKQEKGLRIR